MEGMKSGTRNQGRLIGDPEMFHAFEGVGKDDPLLKLDVCKEVAMRAPTLFPSLT